MMTLIILSVLIRFSHQCSHVIMEIPDVSMKAEPGSFTHIDFI